MGALGGFAGRAAGGAAKHKGELLEKVFARRGVFEVEQLAVEIVAVLDRADTEQRCLVEFHRRYHNFIEYLHVHRCGLFENEDIATHAPQRLYLVRVSHDFARVVVIVSVQP